MVACAPPLLVMPVSGRRGRPAGSAFGSGARSTASTTVPYRSAFFDGVTDGEAVGVGEAEGVEAEGGGAAEVAVRLGVVTAARGGGTGSGGRVTTYAPPATRVAPAVTATAGLASTPSTLADQPTEVPTAVAATAVLPPKARESV